MYTRVDCDAIGKNKFKKIKSNRATAEKLLHGEILIIAKVCLSRSMSSVATRPPKFITLVKQ
jgi:hypothetical protein